MTGNHNAAIDATTGDFVCLIGDDDTVTAEAIQAVVWAREQHIDILCPDVVSNYAWPDFRSRFFGSAHASRLYLPSAVTPPITVESNTALANALRNAAQGTDELPKLYHGFVKRELLENIRARTGAVFHGSSPDVSASIALALTSKTFVRVGYPLTIPGASGGSNTGRSAMNKHKGKLSHEEQTSGHQDAGWSVGVPKFFSVETVWANAALATVQKLAPAEVRKYNFVRLIALCEFNHPEFRDDIAKAIIEIAQLTGTSEPDLRLAINREKWRLRLDFGKKVIKRLRHPTASGGRPYTSGLTTVADAPPALSETLRAANWSWRELVRQAPRSTS
jgi:hypothetical protein